MLSESATTNQIQLNATKDTSLLSNRLVIDLNIQDANAAVEEGTSPQESS